MRVDEPLWLHRFQLDWREWWDHNWLVSQHLGPEFQVKSRTRYTSTKIILQWQNGLLYWGPRWFNLTSSSPRLRYEMDWSLMVPTIIYLTETRRVGERVPALDLGLRPLPSVLAWNSIEFSCLYYKHCTSYNWVALVAQGFKWSCCTLSLLDVQALGYVAGVWRSSWG